ncbi:MAG TPA: thiamine pyrophosphate-requiring protein [Acidimicrobiales bacterium]|nr:thiamine pyrophosphate-requiring protein [Acidimicrobiales bacterium]
MPSVKSPDPVSVPGDPASVPGDPADVRTCAEDVLYLLGAHGVEVLFLNPGTDSAPVQEAAATLAERGVPSPRVVACSFEAVALAAAHGYWQATGDPQAVWVHVDAGTQNLGAMVHNVLRDRAGVVVLAGRTPYGEGADDPGGRDTAIHWPQDVPDQAGIVRGYAKWTAELVRAEDAPRVVGRAVQVAAGGIPGLAYLTISRDVLMQPAAHASRRRLRGWARPHPPALAPRAVEEIADLLAAAERPVLVTTRIGRRPDGMAAVTRFAEVAGAPVVGRPEALNVASDHPLARTRPSEAGPLLEQADLVVVVEADVPWIPRMTRLAPGARVVHVDPDPLHASIPLWTYPVELSACADGALALVQLADALEARRGLGTAAGNRWVERAQLPSAADRTDHRSDATRRPGPGGEALGAADVLAVLGDLLDPDDVVVEEAVTNAGVVADRLGRSRAGTLTSAGGAGLGWALGAAVGIRMALPDRRVVAVVGDGSFMFAVPTAALCLAAEAEAPFVTVVLDNDGYRASRLPVFSLFPEGPSAAAHDAVGTRFRRPPDFAAVAEACGALGRNVEEEAGLRAALEEAFAAVDAGRAAVVAARIGRD